MYRPWAFWRRVQYLSGMAIFLIVISMGTYALFFRAAPSCFDGKMNGLERGVDCGGACQFVCIADVEVPVVKWGKAFKISNGMYNAVAYVQNRNKTVGTKKLNYTFQLKDVSGSIILEKSGVTFLPPDSEYPIFEGRLATGDKIPVTTTLTLVPVTEWQVFTDTRSQFVTSSPTLINVDSMPRLDASLLNTSLVDVRDVDIVATIFTASGTPLTASRTVVPLFEARTKKKVTFTWPEPIAKILRSCEVPTDVMLAIDLSGSMDNDGGTPPEPIASARNAAASFIDRLKAADQIGVTTFASHGLLVHALTTDKSLMRTVVQSLTIDPQEQRGGTNIGEGIIQATNEFLSGRHSNDARKVLIVFTDGKANLPDPDGEAFALEAAAKAKAADVIVFTIGLGTDLNHSFLSALASDPKNRYLAPDKSALDTVYRSISDAICEDGAAVIDIVPKVNGELNDNQN